MFTGKSDPFCFIYLCNDKTDKEEETKQRTTVKYATLEPKWNEKFKL